MPFKKPPLSIKPDITEEAAYWCMRINAKDCTAKEREQFQEWISQSRNHANEYRAMLEIWQLSEHLPSSYAPSAHSTVKPWGLVPKALAAGVMLAAATLLGWYQGWIPEHVRHYQAQQQVKNITLADGSEVQLNFNTDLWEVNFRDRRTTILDEGEAFFKVQHNPDYPFFVKTGKGQVKVTGTQFNVWKDGEHVVVNLTEGQVEVYSNTKNSSLVTTLLPGMQAQYDDKADNLPRVSDSTPDVLAWRDGKLVLNDLTLNKALPLINRYLDKPVGLADMETGELRIGGIYDTANILSLVTSLPRILPVYLTQNKDGALIINRTR